MRKVLPLVGSKALKAFGAFNTLLLGLKMTPMNMSEDYVAFFESFKTMDDGQKETELRKAVAMVPLTPEEVETLVCFTTDQNGVPFSEVNVKNLALEELFDCIVAVCVEIGRIKVDLVSEDEKKKFQTSPLTLDGNS